MREFETGATRDTDEGKADYEGFLSPLVIERFGQYMLKHQKQADGNMRASDNWQKGIPTEAYMKSGWRHFVDWWKFHRGHGGDVEEILCAVMFNVMGYLHERLLARLDQDGTLEMKSPLPSKAGRQYHTAPDVAKDELLNAR